MNSLLFLFTFSLSVFRDFVGEKGSKMLLRTKLHGRTYEFPDLRLLMGKANEEKSGDRLAGVGAETAAERVAAKLVLAEVPLWVLRGKSGCAL